MVAFLGADGAGKTSVIKLVQGDMEQIFRKVKYFHLRPHLGRRQQKQKCVTDPHGKPPRGVIMSAFKLVYLWCDYTVEYWLKIFPLLVRGCLVIFDRYYHDIIVDPVRYRHGAPLWMAKITAMMIPDPDIWILLNASPEVLQKRKQEVNYQETSRQQHEYEKMVGRWQKGYIVDASQNPHEVAEQVEKIIIAYMAKQTGCRYIGADSWGENGN